MVLLPEVEELIASLRRRIAALAAEVADLRWQLGQDSSNSFKLPSSDGLKKKPCVSGSLRGRRARRAAARRAMRAARSGHSPIPFAWFGTKRASAAIAVRRSIRSQAQRSRSARRSMSPSAAHGYPNICLDFPLRIVPRRDQGAFLDGVVSPTQHDERNREGRFTSVSSD